MDALARFAPGLARLRHYEPAWWRADVAAGVSVAAVAIPTAIAYAQLAGFPAVVGLYASVAPLIVYAIFGTSRQLIVNPDAATCAMVAAIVAPLAAGDATLYTHLATTLAVLTGLVCIVAGLFRLGFLADFLGKPVLVGFMNGIAISIVLGQIGKVFGFAIESGRIVPRLLEFLSKLPETHVPTLIVGVVTFAVLRAVRRFLPRLPAPLIALVVAVVLVEAFALDRSGVAVLGHVPAGLPPIGWTPVPSGLLGPLLTGAGALALVSMTSGMVTARSFATRNRYDIDVDREFIAIGACNVAAGLSQGFAVTGADSRTAVSDSMGGRTQVTGLVAAVTMTLVLLFLTAPLRYLPGSALGAVLISAGLGLFDWRALVRFRRIGEGELLVCVAAMLGVVALGAIQGIGVAVALSMLVLLIRSSRPADAVLGRLQGIPGFVDLAGHEGAAPVPGLLLYRFTASVIFYNAAYFERRVLAAADAAPHLPILIIDASPIVHLDSTGADAIAALSDRLGERGVRMILGGVLPRVHRMLDRSGVLTRLGPDATFPTLRAAVEAHEQQAVAPALAPAD
jgi:high affinity sulfate transporter 1